MYNIKEGDILIGTFGYGWETHLAHFYKVEKVGKSMCTLVKLISEHKYESEYGKIYYDTPEWVRPTNIVEVQKNWKTQKLEEVRFRRKIQRKGDYEYVQIETYERATQWDGEWHFVYNYH